MKTKEQRYKEAVERNLKNFQRVSNNLPVILKKAPMAILKQRFGIRDNDTRYDDQLKKIFGKEEVKE